MVSMTLTGTRELIDALDAVQHHRPGTAFWVNAAQQVFDALADIVVMMPAPQANRYGDASRAISDVPRRYGRGSRGRLMMQPEPFWLALDRLGLSQNAVARTVGITPACLSGIVQRKSGASVKTAQRLAEAVGVPMDELFMREVA